MGYRLHHAAGLGRGRGRGRHPTAGVAAAADGIVSTRSPRGLSATGTAASSGSADPDARHEQFGYGAQGPGPDLLITGARFRLSLWRKCSCAARRAAGGLQTPPSRGPARTTSSASGLAADLAGAGASSGTTTSSPARTPSTCAGRLLARSCSSIRLSSRLARCHSRRRRPCSARGVVPRRAGGHRAGAGHARAASRAPGRAGSDRREWYSCRPALKIVGDDHVELVAGLTFRSV